MVDYDPKVAFQEERRRARANAEEFFQACQSGDEERFHRSVYRLNDGPEGWRLAFKKVARLSSVDETIRYAFNQVWLESKQLPLSVGDHRTLCGALRILMPPYEGPAVQLYRGTLMRERRRRIYGISWSMDIDVAARFAERWQSLGDEAVLLRTLAPPEAVMAAIVYPRAFTPEEKAEDPEAEFVEFHDEREHLLDRRRLNAVTVVRQFPPAAMPILSKRSKIPDGAVE
jgi:hypothetical protein